MLMTVYVQYSKNLTVKKWLSYDLVLGNNYKKAKSKFDFWAPPGLFIRLMQAIWQNKLASFENRPQNNSAPDLKIHGIILKFYFKKVYFCRYALCDAYYTCF